MGIFELPEGYTEIRRVNLQKDIKLAILINVVALIIVALLVLIGLTITPMSIPFTTGNLPNLLVYSLDLLILLIGLIAYLISHEFVHGVFIKKYSGKKAKYGFTGIYAYAGSDAYFNKRHYLIIALAPVVFFGVIFLLLNLFLPLTWFWLIYFFQIFNLSGSAGDFYVAYLMLKSPDDVLTTDEGFEMILYSKNGTTET